MSQIFEVHSIVDLKGPARALSEKLKPGTVVCFQGEMGAGKTTFIKVLLREMGVQEEVDSPTFALVNEYDLPDGMPVFHFDFYRLNDLQEAIDIGLEDYLDSGGICLMEWPDVVEPLLPDDRVKVKIVDVVSHREVSIQMVGGTR